MAKSTLCALLLSVGLAASASSSPSDYLISSLPGLTWDTSYKQYSGFLELENGHMLHFWFLESQRSPSSDPVTLWLNGGPGCSSLDGLLYENGPFRVNHSGGLTPNGEAWNLVSSVLYLEAPVGVGFSYAKGGDYAMNDNSTADDNYSALLKFFAIFEDFAGLDFFVTGESYGGVYVPSLVLRVLAGNAAGNATEIRLRGFAVGNGLSSYAYNDESSVWFAYFHGLVDDQLWAELQGNCCTEPYTRQTCDFTGDAASSECNDGVDEVMAVIYNGSLNWYNIYGDCFTTVEEIEGDAQMKEGYKKYLRMLDMVHHRKRALNTPQQLKNLKENVPCIDATGADIYLNRDDVKEAIHVSDVTTEWTICSDTLDYTTLYDDMTGVYNEIFAMDSDIYAVIYNGDTDLACNFLGDEWFVTDFGFTMVKDYREWFINATESYNSQQVAGWTVNYDRISYVTVRGSGHMVPQYKPFAALKMFKYFLNNEQL